jgi:hypothetical protein
MGEAELLDRDDSEPVAVRYIARLDALSPSDRDKARREAETARTLPKSHT